MECAVEYACGNERFRGHLLWQEPSPTARPLLLLVPNFMGITAANLAQAREVMARGHAVFVVDMFGIDRQPADVADAVARIRALFADRDALLARARAARQAAQQQAARHARAIAPGCVSAIGYCFGGAVVLEMARAGDDLAAVVSLHGRLWLDHPGDSAPSIRARILALHGDADPLVGEPQVEAFVAEMRARGADWQLVRFGGAVHSFTDPQARDPGRSHYDARITRRAYAMMDDFLGETER